MVRWEKHTVQNEESSWRSQREELYPPKSGPPSQSICRRRRLPRRRGFRVPPKSPFCETRGACCANYRRRRKRLWGGGEEEGEERRGNGKARWEERERKRKSRGLWGKEDAVPFWAVKKAKPWLKSNSSLTSPNQLSN